MAKKSFYLFFLLLFSGCAEVKKPISYNDKFLCTLLKSPLRYSDSDLINLKDSLTIYQYFEDSAKPYRR